MVVVVDEAERVAVIKGEHEAFAVHDRRVDDGVVRQLDETDWATGAVAESVHPSRDGPCVLEFSAPETLRITVEGSYQWDTCGLRSTRSAAMTCQGRRGATRFMEAVA